MYSAARAEGQGRIALYLRGKNVVSDPDLAGQQVAADDDAAAVTTAATASTALRLFFLSPSCVYVVRLSSVGR